MTILAAAEQHPAWRWLRSKGWKIVPDTGVKGSGNTDLKRRLVLIRPSVYTSPNSRHSRFVLPHELWHAVHGEAYGYACPTLMAARRLDRPSAIEVAAQACVRDGTTQMTAWIRGSIRWHNGHGYRYTWGDVRSVEAVELARRLRAVIQGGA